LIVDDDDDITTTLRMGLENNDKTFQMYACNDPLELLSEFIPNFYDLLLVDINMPNMNGFELCEKILKRQDTRVIQVSLFILYTLLIAIYYL
jgi:CheY-like chemotaxis protein